jgi:hypothetical protein
MVMSFAFDLNPVFPVFSTGSDEVTAFGYPRERWFE